ncbi:hypothetical protein M422DRAFT_246419 [Sphaerobolus stellatus SS14]|nr:hypothetical protein M422DRAFT_246419 [Sphaerobolus stellatus SS14]
MAPKRKTVDKVPAGTSDATDSGSTSNVMGRNDPTLDPGKDPSQTVSAVSEMNIIHPMTQSTHVADQLAQLVSEQETSEDPTQTPNPHGGSGDLPLPKTYSDYSEPSERSALADPDPEELALGNQIQEMLDTINEHMDECSRGKDKNLADTINHDQGKIPDDCQGQVDWLNKHIDEELTNGQPNIDYELMQSTPRPNNRSGTKHVLSKARTELSAKTAVLEWLYADQAPEGHLNQAATAARNTRIEYEQLLRLSKNTRVDERRENPLKSVCYAPFDGIEDNDTDSETTVRNHWEGSLPFQHLEDKDTLDISRMIIPLYEWSTGVKVTPPDKYSGEQSFEALKTFVKGLLRWLDMHSMLDPDAYKYQVLFLGMRLEGKALKWFDKTVEPRKYQGTPMDLEQVMTGLYSQYIPSLARCEASNKFDLTKQGTLSVQEFATELELYVS